MKKSPAVLFILILVFLQAGFGQARNPFQMTADERAAYFAKIGRESEENWKQMVDLVGITLPSSLPPAADDLHRPRGCFQKAGATNWTDSAGNTYTRTAWGTWNNYDESIASPFPTLPDPLKCTDGRRVLDTKMWWNERRKEIVSQFDEDVLGTVPSDLPSVRWEVVATNDSIIGNIPCVTKHVVGHVDNSRDTAIVVDIELSVTLPAHAVHPVPVIMEFGFVFPPGLSFPGMPRNAGPSWQEQVLHEGWGYAIYVPTSVQPDNGAGLREGIIGLGTGGKQRAPGEWGALRAWAWGASRVMDYFEKDKAIDAKRIGIEGVSRYGKAVLVAMAYDPRFAIVLVGSSGKGGATLYRRNFGEAMGNICSSSEFHWFAGNLLKFVDDVSKLPVDSHELIALCAPRPVFISCGSPTVEGRWVDDAGQFQAEAAAAPVYSLFGDPGLGTTVVPPMNTLVAGHALAYRQHDDGHTVGPNWPHFLQFARGFFADSALSSPK